MRRAALPLAGVAAAWLALVAAYTVMEPTAAFPAQAAIYWRDTGETFSEDRVVYFLLPASDNVLECEVPLPAGSRVAALRLDPSRRAGTRVYLSSVLLVSEGASVERAFSGAREWTLDGGRDLEQAAGDESPRVIQSTGEDMYLESPRLAPGRVESVRLRYRLEQRVTTRDWLAWLLSGGNLVPQPPPPPDMVEPNCREVRQ